MKNVHPVFQQALRFHFNQPPLMEKEDAARLKRDLESQTGARFRICESKCKGAARFYIERAA